jgi:hypothetical protein
MGYRLVKMRPTNLEKSAFLVVTSWLLLYSSRVTAGNEEVLKAATVLQGCPITGAFT